MLAVVSATLGGVLSSELIVGVVNGINRGTSRTNVSDYFQPHPAAPLMI